MRLLPVETDFAALAAGIRAAAQPAADAASSPLAAGALLLNPETRVATVKRRPLRLTGKEYDLLTLLLRRKGAVLSKAALLDHLYGGPDAPAAKIIDVFICRLRRKLGQAGAGASIGTVRGRGYVLRDPPALSA